MYTTSNICSEFCVNTHQILSQLSPTFQSIFLEKNSQVCEKYIGYTFPKSIKSNIQETHIYTNCVFWSTSFTDYLIKIRHEKILFFDNKIHRSNLIHPCIIWKNFFNRYKTNRKFIITVKLYEFCLKLKR